MSKLTALKLQNGNTLYTFIGRFSPPHKGHLSIARQALVKPNDLLLLLVGSANRARSLYNPFTFQERVAMLHDAILETCGEDAVKRCIIAPIPDTLYNDDQWLLNVQHQVAQAQQATTAIADQPYINSLIGHQKDGTSYYLKMFPQWQNHAEPHQPGLDATTIRSNFFGVEQPRKAGNAYELSCADHMSGATLRFLDQFSYTPAFKSLLADADYAREYRKDNQKNPFETIFHTSDALVVQSGHIALIERNEAPGKGLLALPGGFVRGKETLLETCLRELREESRLRIPAPILKDYLKSERSFDNVYRSIRGRVITQAFHFQLPMRDEMEHIKGGSDAKRAIWVPYAELRCENMFEDHYFIIQQMLRIHSVDEMAPPTWLHIAAKRQFVIGA